MTFDSDRPTAPEPIDPREPASFATQPVVATGPRAPLVKPKSLSRALNAVLAIAVVVAVGGIAFAIGRTTAPAAAAGPAGVFPGGFPNASFAPNGSFTPNASGGPNGFPGGGQGGFGGLGGGLTVTGTVLSFTADTLTIETDAGQTVELGLDPDTTYHRKTDGAAADVATGSIVEVQLDFAGGLGRPTASAGTSGPVGTASSVTVVQ